MPGSLKCTPANPKRHKNTAQEKKHTKTITGQKKKIQAHVLNSSAIIVRIPMVLSMATK